MGLVDKAGGTKKSSPKKLELSKEEAKDESTGKRR